MEGVVKCPGLLYQSQCKFSVGDPPRFSVPIETEEFQEQQSNSPYFMRVSRTPRLHEAFGRPR